MTENKQEIGKHWEEVACEYLINKGYRILKQNWRYKHLEIDIIAENENFLVIVEVKYRSYTHFGSPEVFVDKQKQKFLIEATNQYIQKNNIDKEVRFDIIAISQKYQEIEIHHIEDAFYPR